MNYQDEIKRLIKEMEMIEMAFHVNLAKDIAKNEGCTAYRYPYTLIDNKFPEKKVDILLLQNHDCTKTVYIIPEQELEEEDIKMLLEFIRSKKTKTCIVYSDIKESCFDEDTEVKPLPA